MQQAEIIRLLKEYSRAESEILEAHKHIKSLKEEIDATRELSAIDYSKEQIGSSDVITDMTYNAVVRIEKLTNSLKKWNDRYERYDGIIHKVLDMFDELESAERDVLRYKYIKGLKWKEVSKRTSYSEIQCKRIGYKAIAYLQDDTK